jgi:hypothetical protein
MLLPSLAPALQEPSLQGLLLFSCSSSDGPAESTGADERRTPVSRNRLWRLVMSLALCTGASHSRHRIALSSLQNKKPLRSCTQPTPDALAPPHHPSDRTESTNR